MKYALIALVLAGVLTACATTPVPYKQATDAPATRVHGYTPKGDGSVTVNVVRDSGFVGGGRKYDLYVNDSMVVTLATSERYSFHVDAGKNIFQLGNCFGFEGCLQLGIRSDKGETVNLRVGPGVLVETNQY